MRELNRDLRRLERGWRGLYYKGLGRDTQYIWAGKGHIRAKECVAKAMGKAK